MAPSTLDNTLYDSFGQRQISTMYTQLNQYHVILEAQPQFQTGPLQLENVYLQSNAATGSSGASTVNSFANSTSASAGSNATTQSVLYTPTPSNEILAPLSTALSNTTTSTNTATSSQISNAVPISAFTQLAMTTEPLSITHQGQFPAVTSFFQSRARGVTGKRAG